jgi:hypothetical protein
LASSERLDRGLCLPTKKVAGLEAPGQREGGLDFLASLEAFCFLGPVLLGNHFGVTPAGLASREKMGDNRARMASQRGGPCLLVFIPMMW